MHRCPKFELHTNILRNLKGSLKVKFWLIRRLPISLEEILQTGVPTGLRGEQGLVRPVAMGLITALVCALIFVCAIAVFLGQAYFRAEAKFRSALSEKLLLAQQLEHQKLSVDQNAGHLRTTLESVQGERQVMAQDNQRQSLRIVELEKSLSALDAERTHLKTEFESRQLESRALYEKREKELRTDLNTQFENIANRIFEKKSNDFSESSEKNINTLLSPLKDQLSGFQKRVEEVYQSEARERHTLKSEVDKMILANSRIGEEAKQLTQALTGQSKTQGDWGEIQLQRLLEASGLIEGTDFVTQGRAMNLKQEESGNAARPDVIVHLPEKKHIIIDSKVSLTHYYQYTKAETEEQRSLSLKSHLTSVYAHIEELADKRYSKLEGLSSPEFEILFMPTEGALTLALHADPEIFATAWKRNIILVGPTNLFAVLKTVASVWTREKQKANAIEIARQSGLLLDKLYGFVDDLVKVGESLGKVEKTYQTAMAKLQTGKGNILSRAEKIRGLGARAQKGLSEKTLLQVDLRDDDDAAAGAEEDSAPDLGATDNPAGQLSLDGTDAEV